MQETWKVAKRDQHHEHVCKSKAPYEVVLCSAQPVTGVNTVALTMNTHTLPIHHFVISKWQLYHFGSKLSSQCLTQVYFPP